MRASLSRMSLWLQDFLRHNEPTPKKRYKTFLQLEGLTEKIVPANFLVTSLDDSGTGTLREAIGLAEATNEQNDIYFDFENPDSPYPNTIVLESGLTITRNIRIHGGDSHIELTNNAVFQPFSGNDPFLYGSGADFTLVTCLLSSTNVTIENLSFDQSYSSINGAAINNNGELHLAGCSFWANYSGNSGGAVFSSGNLLDIDSCGFGYNHATYSGGALCVDGHANGVTTNINNSQFDVNYALNGNGGGAYIAGGSSVNVATVTDTIFKSNEALNGSGGGIFFADGSMSISGSNHGWGIDENLASDGGGIYMTSVYDSSVDTPIHSNVAYGEGGTGGIVFFGTGGVNLDIVGGNNPNDYNINGNVG